LRGRISFTFALQEHINHSFIPDFSRIAMPCRESGLTLGALKDSKLIYMKLHEQVAH